MVAYPDLALAGKNMKRVIPSVCTPAQSHSASSTESFRTKKALALSDTGVGLGFFSGFLCFLKQERISWHLTWAFCAEAN